MNDLDRQIDRLHGPGAAAALDRATADGSIFADNRPTPTHCPSFPACTRDVSHAHWSDDSITYGGTG